VNPEGDPASETGAAGPESTAQPSSLEPVVRLLRATDDRRGFSSGHSDLDRYFREHAGRHSRKRISHIEVADLAGQIVGYSATAPGQITANDLPAELARRLPRHPLPILRLARLAVAEDRQRRGIGGLLLRNALRQALDLRDGFGCVGVVVDAKAGAIGYYAAFGFEPLPVESGQIQGTQETTTQMFLPIGTIEAVLANPADG
jgi:predicted N-acetyltransferase YhbS